MGAAEGVVGHSGRSGAEETARECPSPRPAVKETQSALSVTLQEPGKILNDRRAWHFFNIQYNFCRDSSGNKSTCSLSYISAKEC